MQQDWFVVQVLSGNEKKVQKTMKENLEASQLKDRFEEVFVPVEKVAEVKQGEQKIREKLLWPGYLLIKCSMDDDVWHYIKNTNGVIGFLGGGKPTPLTDQEVKEILSELHKKKEEVVHKYDVEVGDQVKVTEGPFSEFTGTVTTISHEKGRLSVSLSIFGRETVVDDLEFWQVDKVANE